MSSDIVYLVPTCPLTPIPIIFVPLQQQEEHEPDSPSSVVDLYYSIEPVQTPTSATHVRSSSLGLARTPRDEKGRRIKRHNRSGTLNDLEEEPLLMRKDVVGAPIPPLNQDLVDDDATVDETTIGAGRQVGKPTATKAAATKSKQKPPASTTPASTSTQNPTQPLAASTQPSVSPTAAVTGVPATTRSARGLPQSSQPASSQTTKVASDADSKVRGVTGPKAAAPSTSGSDNAREMRPPPAPTKPCFSPISPEEPAEIWRGFTAVPCKAAEVSLTPTKRVADGPSPQSTPSSATYSSEMSPSSDAYLTSDTSLTSVESPQGSPRYDPPTSSPRQALTAATKLKALVRPASPRQNPRPKLTLPAISKSSAPAPRHSRTLPSPLPDVPSKTPIPPEHSLQALAAPGHAPDCQLAVCKRISARLSLGSQCFFLAFPPDIQRQPRVRRVTARSKPAGPRPLPNLPRELLVTAPSPPPPPAATVASSSVPKLTLVVPDPSKLAPDSRPPSIHLPFSNCSTPQRRTGPRLALLTAPPTPAIELEAFEELLDELLGCGDVVLGDGMLSDATLREVARRSLEWAKARAEAEESVEPLLVHRGATFSIIAPPAGAAKVTTAPLVPKVPKGRQEAQHRRKESLSREPLPPPTDALPPIPHPFTSAAATAAAVTVGASQRQIGHQRGPSVRQAVGCVNNAVTATARPGAARIEPRSRI